MKRGEILTFFLVSLSSSVRQNIPLHLGLSQVTHVISKGVIKFLKTVRAASNLNMMAYVDLLAEELLCRVRTKVALSQRTLEIIWCLCLLEGSIYRKGSNVDVASGENIY